MGQASGYQSTEPSTNPKGAGTSTLGQDPFSSYLGTPGPRRRVFHYYFSVPPSHPRGSQKLDSALLHFVLTFVLPFLLARSLSSTLSFLLRIFPSPASAPPSPASSPGPILPFASVARVPSAPHLPSPHSAPPPLPLRSQPLPQPISARPPAAPPPGGSGRARRSPGGGCGGRRRGAGADGTWRTGGAGAGLAGTRARRAVSGRGGRCGPPGMGQPGPGGAEPEARAARGPGLRGGRPGG